MAKQGEKYVDVPYSKNNQTTKKDGWWKERLKSLRYALCTPVDDARRHVNKVVTFGNLLVKDVLFSQLGFDIISFHESVNTPSGAPLDTKGMNFVLKLSDDAKQFVDVLNIARCMILQYHRSTDHGVIYQKVMNEISIDNVAKNSDYVQVHDTLVADMLAHLDNTELLLYGYESNTVSDAVSKYNMFVEKLRTYDFTKQGLVRETSATGMSVRNLYYAEAPVIMYTKSELQMLKKLAINKNGSLCYATDFVCDIYKMPIT